MKKFYTFLKVSMLACLFLTFSGKAAAQLTTSDLAGTWTFTCDFTLADQDYEGIVVGDSQVKVDAGTNLSISNYVVPELGGVKVEWYAQFDATSNTVTFNSCFPSYSYTLSLADSEGNFPYGDASYEPTWEVVDANTINVPDFTVVNCDFANGTAELIATVKNGTLVKQASSQAPVGDMNFAGTYTVNVWKQFTDETTETTQIEIVVVENESEENSYYVTKFGEWNIPDYSGEYTGVTSVIKAVGKDNVLTILPSYLTSGAVATILGGNQKPGATYNPDLTITLSCVDDAWTMSAFTTWELDWMTDTYTYLCLWSPLSVKADLNGGSATPGEPVTFAGTYTVFGYYYDYEAGDYSDDTSFLLVIDENNVVTQIAGYDLTALAEQGYNIYGVVDGNTFTFTSPSGFYLSFDQPFPILGGNPWDSAYTDEGIELTFENGEYNLSDFSIWLYDVTDNSKTKKLAWIIDDVKVGDVAGDEPGDEPGEGLPYLGEYTVKGTKVTYTDGVAGETHEVSFLLTIVEDEDGDYGITTFAGYDIPDDSWGYPGIWAWEGDEANIVEFYASSYTTLNEEGNVIVGSASTSEYAEEDIDIVFNTDEAGTINDFTIWKAEFDDWGDLISATILASWSNLTFVAGDQTSAVESIIDNNAPVEFYNLQGVKVQNPSNGIYIIRQGDSTKKVVIK